MQPLDCPGAAFGLIPCQTAMAPGETGGWHIAAIKMAARPSHRQKTDF